MEPYMTGQEKYDLLIQVTAQAGLTVYPTPICILQQRISYLICSDDVAVGIETCQFEYGLNMQQ